jgi:acyl-CoA synthetase (NDP forming)
MARPGVDLLLGGRRDPTFGPVVVLGAGGIYAEILGSVARRVAPLSRREAESMVDELAIARILRGARGQAACDVGAVVDALLALARLLVDAPEIAEVDVNPLRVHAAGQGVTAIDARIILAR